MLSAYLISQVTFEKLCLTANSHSCDPGSCFSKYISACSVPVSAPRLTSNASSLQGIRSILDAMAAMRRFKMEEQVEEALMLPEPHGSDDANSAC